VSLVTNQLTHLAAGRLGLLRRSGYSFRLSFSVHRLRSFGISSLLRFPHNVRSRLLLVSLVTNRLLRLAGRLGPLHRSCYQFIVSIPSLASPLIHLPLYDLRRLRPHSSFPRARRRTCAKEKITRRRRRRSTTATTATTMTTTATTKETTMTKRALREFTAMLCSSWPRTQQRVPKISLPAGGGADLDPSQRPKGPLEVRAPEGKWPHRRRGQQPRT